MDNFEDQLENLRQHILDTNCQNWLFGAGISLDAKIPLMYPLTERVTTIIEQNNNDPDKEIISKLKKELPSTSHIEHYLSHLGDLLAIAERSKGKQAILDGTKYNIDTLMGCYTSIISAIGDTVRYGYVSESEIGTADNQIIDITHHLNFVEALFSNRSNLERRSTITFFTTNYDTLLEDSLALNKMEVIDGFSGGAVGFWNPAKEFARNKSSNECFLYKLHGSVDWHRDENKGLVRARYGTKYLSDPSSIMIYPQATKYVETQKDPFSSLFNGLRSTLNEKSQNILVTCGYSFGDEHINSEIESCLNSSGNCTTVVAFIKEDPDSSTATINPTLDKWLNDPIFGKRVFVAGEKGLYNSSTSPCAPENEPNLNWWRFSGLTTFLKTGEVE